MNVINYRVSLDMFDVSSQITIKAKKGDSACKIHITLTENGKIYKIGKDCYATFNAKKADGNFVYDNCTIENNTIVYDFASSIDENGYCQISAYEGAVDCEVTLYKGDSEKLTSPRFTLVIDGTVYNGEEIASTTEVDALKELIKEVNEVINEANEVVEEIETKIENGELSGVGEATEQGGEIFNDYTNNQAGIKGYQILSITLCGGQKGEDTRLAILVDDAKFHQSEDVDERALKCYEVGDVINLDIASHHYGIFEVYLIQESGEGNTIVFAEKVDTANPVINESISLATTATDNWIWVAEKSFGEPVTQTYYAHAEGLNNKAIGLGAHAEGKDCQALGNYSHAEGRKTKAHYAAHAEGRETYAKGEFSHAEGYATEAKGKQSHAEGNATKANGVASHSEGSWTEANGKYAHAEGDHCKATGDASHAGGYDSEAVAYASFAHGLGTKTDTSYQSVVGKYNGPTYDTLFVVGNGASDSDRRNALEVLEDGSANIQTMGDKDNSVATKGYVDSELATFDFIKVVNVLPESGLPNKIYLVPRAEAGENNLFDEYIWVNDSWEFITTKTVEVDLTDYATKDEVTSEIGNSLSEYVKNTDIAKVGTAGLVWIASNYNLMGFHKESKCLTVKVATNDHINRKLNINSAGAGGVIDSSNYDYAVKQGIINNKETLTDEEKLLAQKWLGIDTMFGDVETALDNIITIQNKLIGGGNE